MLSVINFEGDEDHLLLLGARNEDDIHIEEYQNESTLITVNITINKIKNFFDFANFYKIFLFFLIIAQ
jgi:hypothetical protein